MAARVVILAAGSGTRMRSRIPKALHPVAGRPLVDWVVAIAQAVSAAPPVVVVGPGAAPVAEHLAGRAVLAEQPEPRGTGDALRCARPHLADAEALVVLYGDVPLLRPASVASLLERFVAAGAGAAILTARPPDPRGYGRILRDGAGQFVGVVEEADLVGGGRDDRGGRLDEVNAGVYVFDPARLWPVLDGLQPGNRQGELYLSEAPQRMGPVATRGLEDPEEMLGVNDRVQLAAVAAVARRRVLEQLMRDGVTVEDPAATWVDADVRVGPDTVLRPGTVLGGRTVIGRDCVIGPFAHISDSEVGDGCRLAACHLEGCRLADRVTVGPFNRVRAGSVLEAASRLGTFTEVNRSRIGAGSAVPHLAYLGDATLGRDVNVGAGTITANWDGATKHPTVVGDGARLGSDTVLVAPVTVGPGAYTGAGSVITQDVPPGALGVARARQRTLVGWARRRRGAAGTGHNEQAPPGAGATPGHGEAS